MSKHLGSFVILLQEKDDGLYGDLLIKQVHSETATVQATDDYTGRVSTDDSYSLRISGATLKDQKTFTCMVVSDTNVMEYPTAVLVHSESEESARHDGENKSLCTPNTLSLSVCRETNLSADHRQACSAAEGQTCDSKKHHSLQLQ